MKMPCLSILNRENRAISRVSLSGLEDIAQIGAILQSLLGGNAKSNAVIAELLTIVEAWPSLSAAERASILTSARRVRT